MRLMMQIGLVMGICLVGEILGEYVPIPIPSSVISMVLLFILLATKAVKTTQLREFSGFILKNMGFFFIPAGVGLLDSFPSFSMYIIPILAVCVINTFLTFLATAVTVNLVMRLQEKIKGRSKS